MVWMFAALLMVMPLCAEAQLMPPGSASMAIPPASARGQGITVSASASQRVPAATARISLHLGSRNNALVYNTQVLQPVVDALVASGVDRGSIALPLNFQGPGNATFATISGDVANPSIDQMQKGIMTVGAAIVAIPGAMLQDVQVTLRASGCSAAQSQARAESISEAHDKAVAIAKQIGVKLGAVVALTSNDQTLTDGGCTGSYSISPYGPSMMVKPSDYLMINVFSSVSITYAIR